jgi:alpha-L-arabinofuranosidase
VEIAVRGASASSGQALVLAAPHLHAHNTFEQPRTIQSQPQKVDAPRDGILVHQLPPASVTRLTLPLV